MSTLLDLQFVFLKNISFLIRYGLDKGYTLTLGEAYRPQFVQDVYYREGKSHTLHSQHTNRLAIDFNLFVGNIYISTDHPIWFDLGNYWKSLDSRNRWGGDFSTLKDYNHFEMQNI